MKKPTSRSASVTPKASSPCGTSVLTVVTGKAKKVNTVSANAKVKSAGAFQLVSERAKKMSSDEFRMSLMSAGIINTNGKLTSNYVRAKKK